MNVLINKDKKLIGRYSRTLYFNTGDHESIKLPEKQSRYEGAFNLYQAHVADAIFFDYLKLVIILIIERISTFTLNYKVFINYRFFFSKHTPESSFYLKEGIKHEYPKYKA